MNVQSIHETFTGTTMCVFNTFNTGNSTCTHRKSSSDILKRRNLHFTSMDSCSHAGTLTRSKCSRAPIRIFQNNTLCFIVFATREKNFKEMYTNSRAFFSFRFFRFVLLFMWCYFLTSTQPAVAPTAAPCKQNYSNSFIVARFSTSTFSSLPSCSLLTNTQPFRKSNRFWRIKFNVDK